MNQLPKEIQKLAENEGLEVVDVLQRADTPRRRFYSIETRRKQDGEQLLLKVFGRGNPSVVTAFYKEVGFLELVTERGKSEIGSYTPRFVKRGNGEQPWYLRTYSRGGFLGDICHDFGVHEKYLREDVAAEFAGFFVALSEFTAEISDTPFFSTLSAHGFDWYLDDWDHYQSSSETVARSVFGKLRRVLKERHSLLNSSADILVHGDLYLKNVLWSGNTSNEGGRPLSVIDWEILHLGNRCFDPVFIWMLGWKDPVWQKKFEKMVWEGFEQGDNENKRELKILWNIVKCSLALRFSRHCEIMLEVLPSRKKDARRNAEKALLVFRKELNIALDNLS